MSWWDALPALLLLAGIVLLPGLIVGAALGLRRIALVTTAPLLSYGALTVAIVLSSRLRMEWGLPPVALGTAATAIVAGIVGVSLHLLEPRLAPLRRRMSDGLPGGAMMSGAGSRWRVTPTSWEDLGVLLASVSVAGSFLFALMVSAIPRPDAVQQTWDAVFHLNAIDRVATLHSASPSTVGATVNLTRPGTFYPPIFHDMAALLVDVLHVQVTTAANTTAVGVACIVWPLSALGLVWSVAPRRTTIAGAALIMIVLGVFPALFMAYGVLWPNLVGLSALPAAVALLAGVVGPVRTPASPTRALVAGAIGSIGLYYAHPGTIFGAVAICLPLLVMAVARLAWRLTRTVTAVSHWGVGGVAGGAVLVAAWLLGARVWTVVDTLPEIKALRGQDWSAVESFAQSIGESLTYSTAGMHPLYVIGLLTMIGAGVVVHDRRIWLVGGHAVLAYLYLLAAGTDDPLSATLTGFWYNDRFRILAMLAVTGVPLAAIGLAWCADHIRSALLTVSRDRHLGLSAELWRRGIGMVSLAAVASLVAWATPYAEAQTSTRRLLSQGYTGSPPRVLTTPEEAELYRSLSRQPDPGKAVVGDPFTGASLAGVLSGRPFIFGHMRNTLGPDQELVAKRFKEFRSDPAVCRAVKRLDIGYATEDTSLFPGSPEDRAEYAGLRGLAGTPGLTRVAQDGTVTAYRVGPCTG